MGAINVDHEVDSVEQGSGDTSGVSGASRCRTATADIASDTARTRVHRCNEQYSGGLFGGTTGPSNTHHSFLEWLTKCVEHRWGELAEFVKEEHPVRSSADFARPGTSRPPADKCGHGCRMMRRPEGRLPDEPMRE